MKKYAIILTSALVAFAACTKESAQVNETSGTELTISACAADCSKTVLVDNVKTYWVPGDAISVFDADANKEFTTSITENSASAKFTGTVQASENGYYALYPYNSAATCDHGTISAVIPAAQEAVPGSFDPAASLLAARVLDENVTFNPAVVLLKVTTETAVSSIKVSANNGEKLAGNVDVAVSDANALAVTGGTAAEVVLSSGSMAAGTYYVVVMPQTCANGLTVTLTNASGAVILKNSSASANLAAGTVYDMGTVNGDWSSDITSTPAALYLHGSATEGNAQQMRKEGDKFVIYNTVGAGKLYFTDGEGNNYYIAGSTLVKGTGATVMAAKEKVTRIIVDFASKSVSYDKVNDKVWIQNAWDGTVTGELSYQGKGKWSGFSSTLPIANNGDDRFSFRVEVNGVNTRWGSNKGNDGTLPDGTSEFYRIYESNWNQWDNLYKIFKGAYAGYKLTYEIEGNDVNFMRYRILDTTESEVVLVGDGLEINARPFRRESADKYVIYTKVIGEDVAYVYNGMVTALTVPADKKGRVTRITLNPATNEAVYDDVDNWLSVKFCADGSDIARIQYQNNGVWSGNTGGVWWRDMGGWYDERYIIVPTINGVNTVWGITAEGIEHSNDRKYNGNEDFWNICEGGAYSGWPWDSCWKLPADLKDGATGYVVINTNNNGVWNHHIAKN